MRVVKFRAWDKEIEKIYPVLEIDFVEEWVSMYSKMTGRHYNWLNNLVLMQYTGLQDKNGVEIYEGDIVRKSNGAIGQVVYLKATASYKLYNNGQIFDIFEADARYLEVIGNIYENPELLQ